MTTPTSMRGPRRLALLAAGAAGLALAAPAAQAQDYSYDNGYAYGHAYDRDASYEDGADELVIEAPRRHRATSDIGAPIDDVSISRVVSFRDLDLRTDWGARELRARVRQAASAACDQMDLVYPIATADSPSCMTTALRSGMRHASEAIRDARGDGDGY